MNKAKLLFLIAVFLYSATNIAYEILGATTLTILLGASVFYFSLTIGVYLASLGIGAWLSAKIERELLKKLVIIGMAASVLGGGLIPLLFGGLGITFQRVSLFDASRLLQSLDIGFWLFNIFAFALIALIGILAGFGLPLFSRLLNQSEELKDALGKVFFLDYLGSLVVSILIPILLFPVIGLVRTSFLMGFFNALGVLLLMIFARFFEGRFPKPVMVTSLAVVLFLNAIGFASGDKFESFLEKKQFGNNELLYYYQSPYQRIDFTRSRDGRIKLFLSGQHQFESGEWERVYHESFAHPAMALFEGEAKPLNVLILGGGDGLLLREVLKHPEVESVTLVDIDQAMIDASKNLAFMREINQDSFFDPRVRIVIADAFKFIEKNQDTKFDLVFSALPGPYDFSLARLYSREFFLNLKKILKDDGLGVIQSVGYRSPTHNMILATVRAADFFAVGYHVPDEFGPPRKPYGFGYVLIAKKPIDKSLFVDKKIAVKTSILETVNLASIFSEPDSRLSFLGEERDAKINSIFRPQHLDYDIKKTFRLRFSNSFKTIPPQFKKQNPS